MTISLPRKLHNWRRDLRTKDLRDRGAAIEQAFRDLHLEALWRERVQANVLRRQRALWSVK